MDAVVAVPIAAGLGLLSTKFPNITAWCKWLYAYAYVTIQKWYTKKRFDLYDMSIKHDPTKVAFLPPKEEITLESPFPESHLERGSDEVFIYGVNSKSECLVTRIARACNDEAEAWIYLKLQNGKVYQLKECSSYQQSCSEERAFTCGGLQMHYISPMRRWRIFFNGTLRETSEQDPTLDRMVYVKFALLWHASSDIYDFTSDVDANLLASAFCNVEWNSSHPPLKKLNRVLNFYAQGGAIHGTVNIDEDPDMNIYLFGERMRYLGDTSIVTGEKFAHIFGQLSKDGTIVHIAEASINNVVERLRFGFLVLPSGKIEPITSAQSLTEYSRDVLTEDSGIKVTFNADGRRFDIKSELTGKQSHFESKKGWEGSLTVDCLNIQMNSVEGRGVMIKGKIYGPTRRNSLRPRIHRTPTARHLVIPFAEEASEIPSLTGGKGSSLGKLTQLSKLYRNFIVPNGVVVTTFAYEAFITKNILQEIKHLEDVLYGNIEGDIKETCQKVMDEIVKANIPTVVFQDVVKNLEKVFGEDLHSRKFAIRSSATGEDTEQMSAAGQMETFLGVSGLAQIMSAVKKCWASQFGFVAAQYKRKNGQILNSPMAVVIQEMIACDVAGVIFTCDPLTGNPAKMSIAANYGLGESVVSGSEEPDIIELRRNPDNTVEIKNKIIGAKGRRIVIKDGEGTDIVAVSEADKNSCCLNDDMALKLGKLSIKIEKSYKSHRDIEWGIWNNEIYLFQSRPVTSGTEETDFEIDHERDNPMRIENEYFTVCNVGEVMPGAMTPLGMDIMTKFFNIIFLGQAFTEWQSSYSPKYCLKGLMTMYYHMMFTAIDLFEKINEGRAVIDAFMIGLFGRILDDEELFEAAKDRYGNRKKDSFFTKNYRLVRSLVGAKSALRKAQKVYKTYRVPVESCKTSEELFNLLMYSCSDLSEAMISHMTCTQASPIWNMFVILILWKANGEINEDVYRDFSHLLAEISEVESADVPSAMQSLAFHIAKDTDAKRFKEMGVQEATEWLKSTDCTAGIKFRDFLDKHGHRCLKEFDLRSATWGAKPETLVKLLQKLTGNISKDVTKKKEDFKKVVSEMKIPVGYASKLLMTYLILPQCRRAVQNREASKSVLIKGVDCWRKAYWHLAKMMVSEGRIPDVDLLFFMTLEEIKELLDTRSPKIISRANHRRRRFPELDKYIFPEITKGFPKPVNLDNTPITPTAENFMMKGIPVSQGVAKGFVRVALTLEEASLLKPGEILLTYSTDIGWTPYFPTLAGVVTELGGLISHGAVVSREYGLPCIAGLHGATRQFQTGDYVLLDGNKGILQKIPPPA